MAAEHVPSAKQGITAIIVVEWQQIISILAAVTFLADGKQQSYSIGMPSAVLARA